MPNILYIINYVFLYILLSYFYLSEDDLVSWWLNRPPIIIIVNDNINGVRPNAVIAVITVSKETVYNRPIWLEQIISSRLHEASTSKRWRAAIPKQSDMKYSGNEVRIFMGGGQAPSALRNLDCWICQEGKGFIYNDF